MPTDSEPSLFRPCRRFVMVAGIAVLTLVLVWPVGVSAQGAAERAEEAGARGIITLACGGIGKDESERMLALEKAHALTLLLVSGDGAYLSGVEVRIDDPLADLAVSRACGPIGLVDVPEEGRYRIAATFDGQTQTQWLDLRPMGGKRLVLRW